MNIKGLLLMVAVGSVSASATTFDDNGFSIDGKTIVCQESKASNGIYQITNAGQLYWFAARVAGKSSSTVTCGDYTFTYENGVSASGTGLYATLTTDITINTDVTSGSSDLIPWPIPIGNSGYFNGGFEGNFHVIRGLYYSGSISDLTCYGLFSKLYKCYVGNLGIEDAYFNITGFNSSSNSYVGLLSGKLEGTSGEDNEGYIETCYARGTINVDATLTKNAKVGGLIAYVDSYSTMFSCYGAVTYPEGTTTSGYLNYYSFGYISGSNIEYENIYGYTSSTVASSKDQDVTASQMSSGEICYKLNQFEDYESTVWYQTLGTDTYPSFAGKEVYVDADGNYYNEPESGVRNVKRSVAVSAENGKIVVSGDGAVRVYSLAGQLVYSGTESVVGVAKGMYIVKVGETTQKVVVK